MLTTADYALLGFYFLLIVSLGFVFRSVNRNASDYFRGGGSLMWWMVGASAFMQQVSAFTFTGVAGKAFRDGSIVVVVFLANALGYFVNYLWTARRFRQMRLITPIEAVRERFGKGNEQFFTWLQLPVSVLYASIWLNSLAVFIAAVFQIDLALTIFIAGGVVVFMSVTGGSWAVVASDFVQMLLIMIVTVITAVLVFYHTDIGGVSNFVRKAPSHYFNWTEGVSAKIVWLWVLASFSKQMFGLNNLMDSARYLCARDGNHASRAALLSCGLMILGPVIWFIPPMMAGIVEPGIASIFPKLNDPGDAAYVYAGSLVLPAGMMGLLLCGMFAATMSSMDSALNRNSGIFVCNFYKVFFATDAPQSHYLLVGRIASTVLGLLVVLAAIMLSRLEGLTLFDIMLLYGGLVALPASIPLTLGIFIKRTPSWSGWSTVVIGLAYSLYVAKVMDPHQIAWLSDNELSEREVNDFRFFAGVLGNIAICTSWFLFSRLFYDRESVEFRKRLDAFFTRMVTPIDFQEEHGKGSGKRQGIVLSTICFIYAGVVSVLGLFVSGTQLKSWIVYGIVAGSLALIGLGLRRSSKRALDNL